MRHLFTCLLLSALVLFTPQAAQSQSTAESIDFAAWEMVATRAEAALDVRRASSTALQELRDELVDWRAQFQDAQNSHTDRIATLSSQLDALGPVPEDGSEPTSIAERRASLRTQLASLQAPKLAAEEAYTHADGMIRETDAIIRQRQTERLLELGPTPLNPTVWPDAIEEISGVGSAVVDEVRSAWKSETQQALIRERIPLILFFLVAAGVLILRGRGWMERLTTYVQSASSGSRRRLLGFVISLGQVVLPVLGILSLTAALSATALLGFHGQIIASDLPIFGLALFGGRWIGNRLFPRLQNAHQFLPAGEAATTRIRLIFAWLGGLWGLNHLVQALADFDSFSPGARAVLAFPIIFMAGFFLFRLSRTLRRLIREYQDDPAHAQSVKMRAISLFAQATALIGIAGPVLAAIGYLTGAQTVIFPAILSLGLLSLIAILSGVSRDLFALATGRDDAAARDALMPILLSLVLTIASAPVFALIWGARVTDLTEIWVRFLEGFTIGEATISPTDFLTFAIVFGIGYVLTRLFQSTLKSSVLPKTRIDPGGQNAIAVGLGYVGIFLSAVIGISTAGINLSSLAIVAGALSVGIGFGLQNIVSNFVSGIILLIERPISEGDWIEVGGNMGYVRDISVRSTRIETFDRTDVIVPNADLVSGTVTNYTRGNLIGRVIVPVGVAYGTDTHKVTDILAEIAKSQPMVLMNPEPAVHFIGFGADSMDFEIRAVLRDVNFSLSVKTEMNHQIAQRFAEEGIEIPFAQRDVWLRNPESLTPPKAPPRKKPATKSS